MTARAACLFFLFPLSHQWKVTVLVIVFLSYFILHETKLNSILEVEVHLVENTFTEYKFNK